MSLVSLFELFVPAAYSHSLCSKESKTTDPLLESVGAFAPFSHFPDAFLLIQNRDFQIHLETFRKTVIP